MADSLPAKDEAIAHLEAFQARLDTADQQGRTAYDALFDAAPEGIALHEIDAAGCVTRVNDGELAILGRRRNARDEIVGIRTTFMQIAGS